MAGTEIPQKPENKQDNLEQEWKKFEPYYNTFMTIDSQEDKEFLKGIGNIILKAEQSKPFLPQSYNFLTKLQPEKVGLFIAEMFIDRILPPEYLLDDKEIPRLELNKELRQPNVFEKTQQETSEYLETCAKSFVATFSNPEKSPVTLDLLTTINPEEEKLRHKNIHYSFDMYFSILKSEDCINSLNKLLKKKKLSINYVEYTDDDLIGFQDFNNSKTNIDIHLKNTLEKLTNEYNQNIKKAKTTTEKLDAIFELVSWVQNIHIFADGNGRVSINLLNFLLEQNSLAACLQPDQANFCMNYPLMKDLYGVEKALEYVYYPGVELFKTFQQHHTKNIFKNFQKQTNNKDKNDNNDQGDYIKNNIPLK